MTQVNTSAAGAGLGAREHEGGPRIVAMDNRGTQNQEAYYLFFVASVGMALNLLVIITTFIRRNLRKMTSAFLVHASVLNFIKSAFCVAFGVNLLSSADGTPENQPPNCAAQGSAFIVLVTTSAINMVAMVCTEAYTFGEENVGGNASGTRCCVLFGILVVYVTSIILHLGPTLIGGDIVYNPDIGSCAFKLGSVTGYVANVMWIAIITVCFVGLCHFLRRLYTEIQRNRPNRVSMLVRHSISLGGSGGGAAELGGLVGGSSTSSGVRGGPRKPSSCTIHEMTQDALHRAKLFVITGFAYVLCWYPLFLLIIIDIQFKVSPKVYQAFSFIAWTEATVEPIILICFDRNLNLLARFLYCDRDHYTAAQLAFLMNQNRETMQQQHHRHHPHPHPHQRQAHNHLVHQHNHLLPPQHQRHLQADEECEECGGSGSGSGAGQAGEEAEEAAAVQNSIELGGEAFHESRLAPRRIRSEGGDGAGGAGGGTGGVASLGRAKGRGGPLANNYLPPPPAPPCRHCSPILAAGETTPLRPTARYASGHDSSSSATRELRGLVPATPSHMDTPQDENSFELNFSPLRVDCSYDPIKLKENEEDEEGDIAF
ncbi:histamine h2 receptor-like [Plakobranchus ocellatus]|uniref:Histamine h2 receptor-like n=1 Tax=Plakobranchus ocellatus TaxID=259542 RepID=A0AAV4D0M4_9GAST|nr:histamine h2 receptor-like [Plakobranchus ocellatus]